MASPCERRSNLLQVKLPQNVGLVRKRREGEYGALQVDEQAKLEVPRRRDIRDALKGRCSAIPSRPYLPLPKKEALERVEGKKWIPPWAQRRFRAVLLEGNKSPLLVARYPGSLNRLQRGAQQGGSREGYPRSRDRRVRLPHRIL
jgi:hypothetical protein